MDKQEKLVTNKDLIVAYIYTIILLFVQTVIDLSK